MSCNADVMGIKPTWPAPLGPSKAAYRSPITNKQQNQMKKVNSQDHPNTTLLALFMAVLACAQLPAQRAAAQTLLNEGFESYAPGTVPTNGGWEIIVFNGIGDPAAQQVDNTRSASGTNSLQMVGADCSNVNFYHPLSLPARFRLETSALVRDSAPGRCGAFAGGVAAVLDPGGVGVPFGAVAFLTNGWLCAFPSGNLDDPVQLTPFTTNTWYRIGMTIDLDQRRFDVDIDGVRRATSLTMPTNGLPTGIEVLSSVGTNTVNWYDDVAVFVPTNGTLSIARAVYVGWPTTANVAYQVQTSSNLLGPWTSIGGLVEGTGGEVGEFFFATNSQGFFTVQETGANGMDWLEGRWQGLVGMAFPSPYVTNTGILQLSVTNSSRLFNVTYTVGNGSIAETLAVVSYSATDARFIGLGGPWAIVSRIDQTNVGAFFYFPGMSGGGGGVLTKQ
jgi:hypothetical protein